MLDRRLGSSPLTRGKPTYVANRITSHRLIPAHAGKTVRLEVRLLSVEAHPRSRGENGDSCSTTSARTGSSPLTRGKLYLRDQEPSRDRLIPAHAGKTLRNRCVYGMCKAHPRSRGENTHARARLTHAHGSSPLTRGKRLHPSRIARERGLIPAHAGKTPRVRPTRIPRPAHPRSRGENVRRPSSSSSWVGSSPLTRGKQDQGRRCKARQRLIPAHAGKTPRRTGTAPGYPAHPRSRGENDNQHARELRVLGSSPLTRGKPWCPPRGPRAPGLIPAHAGKTSDSEVLATAPRAHPRSRGENRVCKTCATGIEGSSPLTRGKRSRRSLSLRDRRLIPAHAGKTSRNFSTLPPRSAHPRSRGEN